MRLRLVVVALAGVFAGCASGPKPVDATYPAPAQARETTPEEALSGLDGVYVYTYFPTNLREAGLEAEVLKRRVQARLAEQGIAELSHAEMLNRPGVPSLDVNVNGVRSDDGRTIIYNVRVSLSEKMQLLRPPHVVVNTRMWNAATVGEMPVGHPDRIYDVALKVVDRFIADYLAAQSSR